MKTELRTVVVSERTRVSSVWSAPDDARRGEGDALILAHGAGADMEHPFMSFVHQAFAQTRLSVKFNFPYQEQHRKAPDPPGKLEATYRAVVRAVREAALSPRRVFIGGKSMGGRMASQIAAKGERVAGLVFLGYPLHPPNKTDKLRVAHLSEIRCPMLFVQGTRDALCDLDLLRSSVEPLRTRVDLHIVEGGNHSFEVLKKSGRTNEEVLREIVDVVDGWIRNL